MKTNAATKNGKKLTLPNRIRAKIYKLINCVSTIDKIRKING